MTLTWSPQAIDDLASLRAYISVDDPAAAKRAALLLANNPQLGQHGDKHRVISGVCWRRAAYGTQIRQGCPTCARTECGRSKGAGFLCSIRSRRAATTIPGAERIETSVGRFLDAVLIFLVPPLLPGENMFQIFLAPAFIIGNALVAVFLAVAFIIRLTVLSVFVPPPLVIGATLLPVLFVPAFFGSAISLPLLGC
jgi:hypothetical protein